MTHKPLRNPVPHPRHPRHPWSNQDSAVGLTADSSDHSDWQPVFDDPGHGDPSNPRSGSNDSQAPPQSGSLIRDIRGPNLSQFRAQGFRSL